MWRRQKEKKTGWKEQKSKLQKTDLCMNKDSLSVSATGGYDKVLSELAVISKNHKELAGY